MTDECDQDISEQIWLESRICAAESAIVKYEDAILQLSTGAVQSYTLDTGQTRQTVTKANLTELRHALSGLENRREVLRAKLYGGTVNVRPGF